MTTLVRDAGGVPIEPPATAWLLPPADAADETEIVVVGADLEPGTLLAGYRSGLFPMPLGRRSIAWFSPDPRAILPLDGLRVSDLRRFSPLFGDDATDALTVEASLRARALTGGTAPDAVRRSLALARTLIARA